MFRLVSFLGIAALTLLAAAATTARGPAEPADRRDNDANPEALRQRGPALESLLSFHAPFSLN